jgi:hypothetical protein
VSLELWYTFIAAAAVLLAAAFAVIMERIGNTLGLIDWPRAGELQERPLPRTGGYAVFAAFWLAILLSFTLAPDNLERLADDNRRLLGVALGSLVLLPVAMVDDYRRLGWRTQLLGQLAAAHLATGSHGTAVSLCEEGIAASDQTGAIEPRARVRCVLARALLQNGDYSAAVEPAREAAKSGYPISQAEARRNREQGVMSDCSMLIAPQVTCVSGRCAAVASEQPRAY